MLIVHFTQAEEFLEELRLNAEAFQGQVLRVTTASRPTAPDGMYRSFHVFAGVLLEPTMQSVMSSDRFNLAGLYRLESFVGQTFMGDAREKEDSITKRINAMAEQIRTVGKELGLLVRAGLFKYLGGES